MIPPRYLSGSAIRSIRLRTYSPPNARPKMNALSISSNECVELPSTRLSMRIQPSSYMNEAAPVRNAAITNHLATGSVTPDVADGVGVAGGGGGGGGSGRGVRHSPPRGAPRHQPAGRDSAGRGPPRDTGP